MNVRRIDHLGLAVRSVEAAERFYAGALGLPVAHRETLADMKLKVVKLRAGDSVLELLEPLPGEDVVSRFLSERGEGFHHVCLEVDDVRAATAELASRGYRPVWPEPRSGAEGRRVNFLRPKETFGTLIELVEGRSSNLEVGSSEERAPLPPLPGEGEGGSPPSPASSF
jgi:methylmalonyl-CoA/ethylmalonyl-CoA epimerase